MRGLSRLISVMVLLTLLIPLTAWGQDCDYLDKASIRKAEQYLKVPKNAPEEIDCVVNAFHRIGSFPPRRSVPVLVRYLSYKRPLNELEEAGITINPSVDFYPAVDELIAIALRTEYAPRPKAIVEPALMRFIERNPAANGAALHNAVRVLVVLHGHDMLLVARKLHLASKRTKDPQGGERLQHAAGEVCEWNAKYKSESAPACAAALNE